MSEQSHPRSETEPESYELVSPAPQGLRFDRRKFLQTLGGGIAVFLIFKRAAALQEAGGGAHRQSFNEQLPDEISAWLHIGEDGAITVYTGKAEMGQNIRTSLTQGVAEELRVPVSSVHLVMGDTELTPFDMGTFGSRTTPTMNRQLRRVASAARDLLIDLAAKRWNVDRSHLVAAQGEISDRQKGRSIRYAQLAANRALAKAVVESDPLTPATEWKVAGASVPKIDAEAFVTGQHQFPSDIRRPGMLYGKVVRPAAFGARLASVDTSAATAIPGVVAVHSGSFIGVAAPSQTDAEHAAAAVRVQWRTVPQTSSRELFAYLTANAEKGEQGAFKIGSVADGLTSATHRLNATYTVAYIQHAPLEPRAAVAEWKDGKVTVWTGTQRPFGVRSELANAFGIPEENVRVIVPDTGAAFGGKHTGEVAVEAARLARAAQRPVKLVWTRQEEFTWAYFRPAGVIEIKSGVQNDGKIVAWEFHNYNSGEAAIRTPYNVPNQVIEFHPVHAPLRQSSYRALAATANHFARESHMDDLAHILKMDPLTFRVKNLTNQRLRAVFEAAANAFDWKHRRPMPGHGYGIAGGVEKGGYVATCAEVVCDRDSGAVSIARVTVAFDCGAVVNPDGLRNQIMGANVMGLGGALFEEIEFENGRILNNRFSKYRVPRFSDVPLIDVVLVDRKDQPSAGAGETPIVGLAPAVGNAIFDATGVRHRSLPMIPNGLKT